MGISSFGTYLKVGDGATSESFTTIFQVLDISGPALAMDTEEITNHSSTGGWEEHVGTILRTGELSFEVNYEPTQATLNATTGIINDMENRTKRNFQLVFPDTGNTTWAFAAYVTGFEPSAPVAGKLSAAVTLKPTGQPTLV